MTSIDNDQEQLLREKSLAFFGAITASVSHELNNVISIIDQTAGLLEDLLYGAQQGRPIQNERLERIATRVRKQTQRGVGIIKRLNRFAHSVDDPVGEFELNNLIENLTALNQRFASLKRVNLETHYSDEPINIICSPFLIQQVLFLCIKMALDASQENDTIIVAINSDDDEVKMSVKGRKLEQDVNELYSDYLDQLMTIMGGNIEVKSDDNQSVFKILIQRRK